MTTDHKFTGQKLDGTGLMYYAARYYDPSIGQFVSPDTIVPDPGLVADYNRYMMVRGNPLRYNDPTGHCPVICLVLLGVVGVALTSDVAQPTNYPINITMEGDCSALSDCFSDVVYLKDFSSHGEDNPIPIDEFETFADKVAADLNAHDTDWPGIFGGRGVYDTPFYNGGESERRGGNPDGIWPAEQQVCIDTLGCSGRSEINYIAQGMWGAATGETQPVSAGIVWSWKLWEYQEKPSENTLFWLQYGYEYYEKWQERQNTEIRKE